VRVAGRWTDSWRTVLGAAIGVGLLAAALGRTDLTEVWQYLAGARVEIAFAAVPLVLANMVLRALRWTVLFQERARPRVGAAFSALMVGYLANNVLPARAGDVLRAYVLGKREGTSKSAVLATVLVERVSDLLALGLMLAAATFVFPVPAWLRHSGLVVGAVAVGVLVIMVGVTVAQEPALRLTARITRPLPGKMHLRLELMLGGLIEGVSRLAQARAGSVFLVLTTLLWLSEIAIVWLMGQMLNLPLSMLDGWIVMLFAALGTMVPALPGQVGAFEFAVVAGMEALGYPGAGAVALAVCWHGMLLAVTSAVGAVCLARSGLSLSRATTEVAGAQGSGEASGV